LGKVNFTPISTVSDPASHRLLSLDPPLAATLARVAARCERWKVRLSLPTEPEWVPATMVPKLLDELLDRIGEHYQTADLAVIGTYFLKRYARGAAAAALVCLATERRVPNMAPENIAFRFGPDGRVQEAALVDPVFAALPGDPDAGHPDANVVPDVAALRRWLRNRFVCGHLAAIVPLLLQRTRRGPRALWGTVSDMCSGTFAQLAELEGTIEAIARLDRESHAFLTTGPPLIQPRPLRPLAHCGALASGWQRVTCCLAYRLPNHGLCASCPCMDSDERERRLRAELEQHPGA
jgi:Ferric iron reductase FhuF-like transporter/FhuF 2Fe-2S C-terminal domain